MTGWPVFFIENNVGFISGTGTSSDPYTLIKTDQEGIPSEQSY